MIRKVQAWYLATRCQSVLRAVAEQWLPHGLAHRPKRAFVPPIGAWSQALFRRYGPSLLDGLLVGLGVLRPQAAVSFAEGKYDPHRPPPLSYKALVLETWLREMVATPGVRLGAPIAE
jgi:asparagine synthase (glutamine-hydrolysing)